MDKFTVLIVASMVAFLGLIVLASCSEVANEEDPVLADTARFFVKDEINFIDEPYITARILVDLETGIEYLYIWDGMAYGGPAITRLWAE